DTADKAALAAAARAAETAYRGGAATVIGQNLQQFATVWIPLLLLQAPCALAMFCLGMVAGRHELFHHVERE
ncbi:hypothetical protein, partial [Acinetobacter nosocomialis]|uniref:hypothetical protein n=1 Tax=Acinetobacter nosocomialis TaxID=106654 RepID=UPI002090E13D